MSFIASLRFRIIDLFLKFIISNPLPCNPIFSPYLTIGSSTLIILLIPFFLILSINVSFSNIFKTGYHINILELE